MAAIVSTPKGRLVKDNTREAVPPIVNITALVFFLPILSTRYEVVICVPKTKKERKHEEEEEGIRALAMKNNADVTVISNLPFQESQPKQRAS